MARRKSSKRRGCRCKNGSRSVRCCAKKAGKVYRKTPDGILLTRVAPAVGRTVKREVREAWQAGKEPDHAKVRQELVSFVDRRKGTMAMRVIAQPQTERMIAYGLHKMDHKVLKHVMSIGAREAAEKAAYVALRVGFKAIPVIGWASLAYDAYQIGSLVHDEYLDEEARLARRARQ